MFHNVRQRARANIRMKLDFEHTNETVIYPGARDTTNIRRLSANNSTQPFSSKFTFSLSRHIFAEEMLNTRCPKLSHTTLNGLSFHYSLQTLSPVFFSLYCSIPCDAFGICYFCSICVYRNKRMKDVWVLSWQSTQLSNGKKRAYTISHLQRWKAISLMPSFMNVYPLKRIDS